MFGNKILVVQLLLCYHIWHTGYRDGVGFSSLEGAFSIEHMFVELQETALSHGQDHVVPLAVLRNVSIIWQNRLEFHADEISPLHKTNLLDILSLQKIKLVLNGSFGVRFRLNHRVDHDNDLVRVPHHIIFDISHVRGSDTHVEGHHSDVMSEHWR